MDLHDRVALITGASGGLGAATARILADEGVHVADPTSGTAMKRSRCADKSMAKGRKSLVVHP